MTTPILVDIGTATQLTAKYEDVSALLAGATLHNGDVIDVSVPRCPDGDRTVTATMLDLPEHPPYGGATLPHCERQPSHRFRDRVAGVARGDARRT